MSDGFDGGHDSGSIRDSGSADKGSSDSKDKSEAATTSVTEADTGDGEEGIVYGNIKGEAFDPGDGDTVISGSVGIDPVDGEHDNLVVTGNVLDSVNNVKETDVTEGENKYAETELTSTMVYDTFSTIGRMDDLTPEQRVAALQSSYETLPKNVQQEVTVPARVEFLNEKQPFFEDGRPNYKWEGPLGFEGPPMQTELAQGTIVDRYGSENGNYVSEVKNGEPIDYSARGIPYQENPNLYHQYEVIQDMSNISQQIENLSLEDIENIETQRDMQKPENERRTAEQIKADAQERYINIQYDFQVTINRANQLARDNGWDVNYQEIAPLQGKIKECFAYTDENGNDVKLGGGEQIVMPASIDTLVYLGYLEEKND